MFKLLIKQSYRIVWNAGKSTESKNLSKKRPSKISYGRTMLLSKCVVYDSGKSRFVKKTRSK